LHVEVVEEVLAAAAVAAAHTVTVYAQRPSIDVDGVDSPFLDRLATCGADERGIARFDVAAELQPTTHEWVERKEHRLAPCVDDECAAGEVTDSITACHGVGMCVEEGEVVQSQSVLSGSRCRPVAQHANSVDVQGIRRHRR
jgi:hypothetical protein